MSQLSDALSQAAAAVSKAVNKKREADQMAASVNRRELLRDRQPSSTTNGDTDPERETEPLE